MRLAGNWADKGSPQLKVSEKFRRPGWVPARDVARAVAMGWRQGSGPLGRDNVTHLLPNNKYYYNENSNKPECGLPKAACLRI